MSSEWRLSAACRGTADPDQFYPTASGGRLKGRVAKAVAVCTLCPVRTDCRDEWLDLHVYFQRGCVAGGWYWSAKDVPTPFPGDEHLLPKEVA